MSTAGAPRRTVDCHRPETRRSCPRSHCGSVLSRTGCQPRSLAIRSSDRIGAQRLLERPTGPALLDPLVLRPRLRLVYVGIANLSRRPGAQMRLGCKAISKRSRRGRRGARGSQVSAAVRCSAATLQNAPHGGPGPPADSLAQPPARRAYELRRPAHQLAPTERQAQRDQWPGAPNRHCSQPGAGPDSQLQARDGGGLVREHNRHHSRPGSVALRRPGAPLTFKAGHRSLISKASGQRHMTPDD